MSDMRKDKILVKNPIEELAVFDGLIEILLRDHTTHQNIIWASSDYPFDKTDPIRAEDVHLIIPHFMKSKDARKRRKKLRAEVFTAPFICKLQNDLIDDGSIKPDEFIDATMLEITCGEAPYLASRYNVVDGSPIALDARVGLLDRKLRLVNQKVDNRNDWCNLARRAYQSIYGYEFQGDNLLLARCNLLLTAEDYYRAEFRDSLPQDFLKELADIISWNLWQFDGIKNTVPFQDNSTGLFNNCLIRDWQTRELVNFPSLNAVGTFSEDEF